MMRSLYSGVSGLRNHQTRMDVIGNNIANVNTVGFKASRTIFQDLYSQNMRAASSPGNTTGGTNPQQIGLGVTLSTIDTLFTRSAAQVTGNTYDLMIENDGFFVVRNGYGASYEEFYTRAGNFYEDKEHYLVTANGYYLQGYKAALFQGDPGEEGYTTAVIESSWNTHQVNAQAANATVSQYKAMFTIDMPLNGDANNKTYNITVTPGTPTTDYIITVSEQGNSANSVSHTLNDVANNLPITVPQIVMTDGVTIDIAEIINLNDLTKLDGVNITTDDAGHDTLTAAGAINSITSMDLGATNNNYRYEFLVTDVAAREVELITYNSEGVAVGRETFTLPRSDPNATPTTDPITRTVGHLVIEFKADYDIRALDGMIVRTDNQGVDSTDLGAPYSQITQEIDRIYVDENLYNISIDKNGNITGVVKKDGIIKDPTTGQSIAVLAEQKVTIGRVVVATFDNQQGLEKIGTNLYRSTANTGEAQYKSAGSDGAGQINPGALEMSNVDLAQEFTDMIVTQRGFQANSRIITVSDTLLEELVNLKR